MPNWFKKSQFSSGMAGKNRYKIPITATFYIPAIDDKEQERSLVEGILRENLAKLEQHIEGNPSFPETVNSNVEFSIGTAEENAYGQLV